MDINLIITYIILFGSILFLFRKMSQRYKEAKKLANVFISYKDSINSVVDARKSERYISYIKSLLPAEINNSLSILSIFIKYNGLNDVRTTNFMLNNLLIDITNISRIYDTYNFIKHNYIKDDSMYHKAHRASLEVLNNMYNEYGKELIDSYLNTFSEKYVVIKNLYIKRLFDLYDDCERYYSNNNYSELKKTMRLIDTLNCNIDNVLDEPNSLYKKIRMNEDNIIRCEQDIYNIDGSIYKRVYNLVRNNEITKEDSIKWNNIKKKIATYRKNKATNPKDVINQSVLITQILDDLISFNALIEQKVFTENRQQV